MSNYSFNPLQLALKPLYEQAKAEDELFAKQVQEKESRTEKTKSFAECCDYILGETCEYAKNHPISQKGNTALGMAGGLDSELVSMIKHYYDEDDIKIRDIGANVTPIVKTTDKPTTETKPKKKEERPKETLENTHVPMQRPKDEKESKKESKKQASNVIVMDMFAGMWDDAEEENTTEQAEEEIDDLPM